VDTGREINAIRIGDTEYLLTVTVGDAVHLTRETGPGETGQSAVPGRYLTPGQGQPATLLRGYDYTALARPRWAAATLCGREWLTMAGVSWWNDEDLGEEEASAPSCRRCLALMDKLFPEPELDDRFDLALQAVTGTVAEHGYAEMWNVPGDQQAALRKQVRSAVKKRTGHPTQTLARGSLLVFVCEPIHQQHAAERERAIAQATGSVLTGQPALSLPTPWPCPGMRARPGDGLMRRCRACRPRCGEDGE
jgi:hypothetical protein